MQHLLVDRSFYVELNNEYSKYNGLPHGSVVSRVLFKIYTNDESICYGTRGCVYADDIRINAQYLSLSREESTLEEAMNGLIQYYRANIQRVNQDKTHVTAFHLKIMRQRGH